MLGLQGSSPGGEALQPTATATTIHVKGGAKGGELVMTDGPFAETKEVFTGLTGFDARQHDRCASARRCFVIFCRTPPSRI
jgi:hypothetical protein